MTSVVLLSALKFIHIWAVIIFVGNSVLGPYRRRQARLTGNAQIIAGTYDMHTASGRAVTVPGFAIAVVSGLALAGALGFSIVRTGWIVYAMALTAAVAVLFVAGIAPLQRQATAAAAAFAKGGSAAERERFEALARKLEPLSHAAHILFVLVIALMVFQPRLPVPW
jgi:uncharacterized membrane protein